MNPMEENPEFWKLLDKLIEGGEIVIDRPKGSRHPEYPDIVYPLDYGYIAGTRAPDGEDVDLWLGSKAQRRLNALVVTVDACKRDTEIKLLIGCTRSEAQRISAFYNDYEDIKGLLLWRKEEE